MKNVKKPVRMCIVCRTRDLQKNLIRLQCDNQKLISFKGIGRSFYVCKDCIKEKKFINYIAKKCKIPKDKVEFFILHFSFYT